MRNFAEEQTCFAYLTSDVLRECFWGPQHDLIHLSCLLVKAEHQLFFFFFIPTSLAVADFVKVSVTEKLFVLEPQQTNRNHS